MTGYKLQIVFNERKKSYNSFGCYAKDNLLPSNSLNEVDTLCVLYFT